MDDLVETLVDEVLTLHAEVAALRAMLGAPLSGDPAAYFDALVPHIDGWTLPLPMTEKQRDIVRERLEFTLAKWQEQQRVAYPGGWRGVRYALGRMLGRARRVIVGAPQTAIINR
jgi:hypothetical protein